MKKLNDKAVQNNVSVIQKQSTANQESLVEKLFEIAGRAQKKTGEGVFKGIMLVSPSK